MASCIRRHNNLSVGGFVDEAESMLFRRLLALFLRSVFTYTRCMGYDDTLTLCPTNMNCTESHPRRFYGSHMLRAAAFPTDCIANGVILVRLGVPLLRSHSFVPSRCLFLHLCTKHHTHMYDISVLLTVQPGLETWSEGPGRRSDLDMACYK